MLDLVFIRNNASVVRKVPCYADVEAACVEPSYTTTWLVDAQVTLPALSIYKTQGRNSSKKALLKLGRGFNP